MHVVREIFLGAGKSQLLVLMLGGFHLHVKERGGTRGQTVWGIPEL